ncbi:MAG: hypothetical protein U0228_29375 [Myxococcaceae bacterium]
MTSSTTPAELRAEHDAVLAEVETRRSTLHFAHAAVSLFLSISFVGSGLRLEVKPEFDLPSSAAPIAIAVGVLVFSYSVVRGVLGARAYANERRRIARLLELRQAIGLDAPLALPGRS